MRRSLHIGLIILAGWAIAPTTATAQDFYTGKTLEFIVGHYVGGGYDIYARAVARHWSRHIPGNPNIVVKNMPGAGSAKAGLHIIQSAPRDGTVIGAVTPGAIMAALLDGRSDTTFDPTRALFIGTANSGTRVCVTWKEAAAQSFDDVYRHKTVLGGVNINDATHDYAYMVKNVTGAQFNVVTGYKGTANVGLAMERREVDGACGWDWASFRAQRSTWLADKKVNVLVQIGHKPDEELTRYGAPMIWKFIKSEEDRKAVELITSQQVFHRSYIAPPGVPAAQLNILRTSFLATMNDKQFLADAEKTKIDIAPLGGDKIQELIAKLADTPDAALRRAKQVIRP